MSTDYSFYALLCGYMPRPEGVQKRKIERSSFFLLPRERKPGCASLPGRIGGCKQKITCKSRWGDKKTKDKNIGPGFAVKMGCTDTQKG